MNRFEHLIESLAEVSGGNDIKVGDNGSCDLLFDDLPVTLRFLESGERILLYSVIGSPLEDDQARLQVYTRLLEANHLFAATGGMALAVDEESGIIAMQMLLPIQAMEPVKFLEVLENFINTAIAWKALCVPQDSNEGQPDPSDVKEAGQKWLQA